MGFKNGSAEYLKSIKNPKVWFISLIYYFIIKVIIERLLLFTTLGMQKTIQVRNMLYS